MSNQSYVLSSDKFITGDYDEPETPTLSEYLTFKYAGTSVRNMNDVNHVWVMGCDDIEQYAREHNHIGYQAEEILAVATLAGIVAQLETQLMISWRPDVIHINSVAMAEA
jgi:glycogen synthase